MVAGIQAFGENSKKSNADALVSDASRISSDVQAWVMKPGAYGGGKGDFSNVSISQLGYQADGGLYENVNGTFAITARSGDSATLTGCSLDSYDGTHTKVEAVITGTGKDAVDVELSNAASDCTPTSVE